MVYVFFFVPDTALVNLNEDEVGHQNGDEADYQTYQQHGTQAEAEDVSRCQRVRRGRYYTVCSGCADGKATGYVTHLHIDLRGDGDTDRNQNNKRYVKEYRNGEHEACKAKTPDGTLFRESGYQFVSDDVGCAAVIHQLT